MIDWNYVATLLVLGMFLVWAVKIRALEQKHPSSPPVEKPSE